MVPHRESVRFISSSQVGAGAFLMRKPDVTLEDSIVLSNDFLSLCQRHVGLYVSSLADPLDERARRGHRVTIHDRVGDAAINDTNPTHRHNAALQATFTAMKCVSSAGEALRLGDRGDGSPAGKAEAKQRHDYLNADHIPDIYKLDSPNILWELKCYSPFHLDVALGNGSQRRGGAASTADGHTFAFGNTLEFLLCLVFGQSARGAPTERALNRRTGEGRVDDEPGQYSDALAKGNIVHLLAAESTGALSAMFVKLLKHLDAAAKSPHGHDHTVYGTGRASPHSFFRHHLAAISSAIKRADALALRNKAAFYEFELLCGVA